MGGLAEGGGVERQKEPAETSLPALAWGRGRRRRKRGFGLTQLQLPLAAILLCRSS